MKHESSPNSFVCKQCEDLLDGVVFAIRRTRCLLGETARAAQAGLIDDLDILVRPAELDAAFDERHKARSAYMQHRVDCHGAFFPFQ